MNQETGFWNTLLAWLRGIFDVDRWQEIWQAITHNKSRSVLTAFGVFWGMFMLVVMVGAGDSLQKGMQEEIEGFATNSCFVSDETTSEPYKGFKKGRKWTIVNTDIPILEQKIPEIQHLSPVLFGGRSTERNVTRGEKSGSFNSKGVYPNYNEIDRSTLTHGRFINEIDVAENRKVCVIGKRVYEVLFNKGENPIGKMIQLNGMYFHVVGVSGNSSNINIGGNAEETVILPFTTMQQAFNQGNKVHLLAITADPGIKVSQVETAVKDELKKIHDISPTDKTGVWSMNLEDMFTMFLYLGIGISMLIWIVGLGTMAAGGIGVSNIMLVTVKERTKEIGIKRALGATPGNIMSQIMTESVILTLIAGILGLLLGVGLLQIVEIVTRDTEFFLQEPQINFGIAIGGLAVILIIGCLAGLIPAKRAIDIKAIEAIRDEN
ncbi:MAG: ABC transporter permease [Paludibacteraceae bacterium]